jgi:hypothetical protein
MEHLTSEFLFNLTRSGFNIKLWERFWCLLAFYKDGKSYEEVIQSLYTQKSQVTAKYHLKVSNSLFDKNKDCLKLN